MLEEAWQCGLRGGKGKVQGRGQGKGSHITQYLSHTVGELLDLLLKVILSLGGL